MEKMMIGPTLVDGLNRWTLQISNVPDSKVLFKGADISEQLQSVKDFASRINGFPDWAMEAFELPADISQAERMDMAMDLLTSTDELIIQDTVILSAEAGESLESVVSEIFDLVVEFLVEGV